MGTGSLDGITWESFDASRVNAEIVPIVKVASMVEFNAEDYRVYLQNIYGVDDRACRALEQWSVEAI